MKRVLALGIPIAGVLLAFAMLGGCDDSCVDTGCVEIEAGADVRDVVKKDVAKEAAPDVATEAATDAPTDAAEEASDAPID